MAETKDRRVTNRITILEEQGKRVMEVLKRIDDRTESLDHIIRGNGVPGIATKIEVIQVKASELAEKVDQVLEGRKETSNRASDHAWQWWVAFGSLASVEIWHLIAHR